MSFLNEMVGQEWVAWAKSVKHDADDASSESVYDLIREDLKRSQESPAYAAIENAGGPAKSKKAKRKVVALLQQEMITKLEEEYIHLCHELTRLGEELRVAQEELKRPTIKLGEPVMRVEAGKLYIQIARNYRPQLWLPHESGCVTDGTWYEIPIQLPELEVIVEPTRIGPMGTIACDGRVGFVLEHREDTNQFLIIWENLSTSIIAVSQVTIPVGAQNTIQFNQLVYDARAAFVKDQQESVAELAKAA